MTGKRKIDKTVLITGAAQRIGRALALDFAGRGWRVGVHYHKSDEAAAKLVEEIAAKGGNAQAFQSDLSQIDAPTKLIDVCISSYGPLDCLINNAALFEPDDISSLTHTSWAAHIDINLRAPVFLAQAFARQLPQDKQGNIINMLDQRVWNLSPDFLSYTTSKSALLTLTQTLAQALAPKIRVNAIGPGPTLASKRQSDRDFQAQLNATLLKRTTSLEEICETVHFILATPSLTGQMIALDAGQHLVPGQNESLRE